MKNVKNIKSVNEHEHDLLIKTSYEPYSKLPKWGIAALQLSLKSILAMGASLGVCFIFDQIVPEKDCQIDKKLYKFLSFGLAGLMAILLNELVECGMNRNKKGTLPYQFWKETRRQSHKMTGCFNKEDSSNEFASLGGFLRMRIKQVTILVENNLKIQCKKTIK